MEAAVKFFAVWLHGCQIVELEIECAGELAIERVVELAVELAVKLVIERVVELAVKLAVVEVRGIERENVGLCNGYVILWGEPPIYTTAAYSSVYYIIGAPYIRSANFLETPYIINSCGKNHVKRYLIELDELNKNIVTLKHLELWSLSY